MIIKVIEVIKDGKTLYVNGTSCFTSDALVSDPMQAIDYTKLPPDKLERDLYALIVPGDTFWAKSGIEIDGLPQVVEFDITPKEISREKGRDPH